MSVKPVFASSLVNYLPSICKSLFDSKKMAGFMIKDVDWYYTFRVYFRHLDYNLMHSCDLRETRAQMFMNNFTHKGLHLCALIIN